MPVPRFGRGQAAAGIDLWQAVKLGEIEWDDVRTEPGQAGQGCVEATRDFAVQTLRDEIARHV
ncbi:hypothetical protein D3C86_2191070 [compost metagenome]